MFTYTGVYSRLIYVGFQAVGFFCREISTCPLTHSPRSVHNIFRFEMYAEQHNRVRVHLLYNMKYRAKSDENMFYPCVYKKYFTDDITFTIYTCYVYTYVLCVTIMLSRKLNSTSNRMSRVMWSKYYAIFMSTARNHFDLRTHSRYILHRRRTCSYFVVFRLQCTSLFNYVHIRKRPKR